MFSLTTVVIVACVAFFLGMIFEHSTLISKGRAAVDSVESSVKGEISKAEASVKSKAQKVVADVKKKV